MSSRRLSAALAAALLVCAASAAADPLAATGRWSAHERSAARTPPMGWNSWNAFTSDIDEDKIMGSANVLVSSGLAAKGYRYVNLDDGWWLKRRASDGRMLIRAARFPSAATANGDTSFRPLTDRLHAMGLKAGIYSDIGRNSCGQVFTSTFPNQPEGDVREREVGLYGHIDQDIGLYFGEWGFDLIKVDGCGVRGLGPADPRVKAGQYRALGPFVDIDSLGRTDIPTVRGLYEDVGRALDKHNPDGDFVYSLCLWGAADVRSWGKNVGAMSRTSEDISPTWSRMLHNLDSVSRRPLYAHPGTWNDPDMLFVGKGDFDADHLEAARSHFALWAMVNAPLLIGYDLRNANPALLEILGAEQVIALNQDPAGNQAVLAFDSADLSIFVKTLASGDKAVAILNRTAAPAEAILTAEHLKFLADADIDLTDLWSGQASRFKGERKFQLAPRQTLLFSAKGKRRLADGVFLSEQPGAVNPAIDGVVTPQADPLVHRAILPWRGTRGAGEPPRYGGWGGAQADRTPYDQELAIASQRFGAGLGVLANSRLEVRNAGFRRFTATVGVDDSAIDRGRAITFLVYGDGKLLGRSRPLKFGQKAQPLSIDVAGVRLIELVARAAKADPHPDPVTWGEAALRR
ncbi:MULTISPECIES: NPCBM/NEW2 domain-containing protein [unclassified Caulobacter]|uniref:NPCBM/NEW2 domain-containing protein n=1 Tax=unclassified Caulobacter TaxID=2648921 RepID=UPI0006FEF280|nr:MULTISPECIES: NPCBM/NEW2 domain-containing protein [unclassified Caulobacter]KQV58470.1 alpha-galactosidase [Caulobacter sp. Root342]KQV69022.1 alpha-galactosidase [Caulobacter sp. Root343]